MSHGDRSRLPYKILSNREEAPALEITEDKIALEDSDNEKELDDQ